MLDARNKYEQTNFRSLLLTSAAYTMSNASPKNLCNYNNILKDHTNLVNSKLNGSSIMSPPVFTINTANQFTVLSLQSQAPQEVHVEVDSSFRRE